MDTHHATAKASASRHLDSVLTPSKPAPNSPKHHDSDHELPPPYTALPELHLLPSYLSACPLKPHQPFPRTIRAHHRLSQLSSITLAGPDRDPLYYVEVRKGFQRIDPLGHRAGIVLRNGPHSRDEVLAAAGEESYSLMKIYAVPTPPSAADANSLFFLPPLEFGTNSRAMVAEKMRQGVLGDRARTFTFFIEVEPLRSLRRQKFEWVQEGDGGGGRASSCGFRLLRVLKTVGKEIRSEGDECDDCAASSSGSADPNVYGEVIATLVFPHSSLTNREAFTLSMTGSAEDGRLGERCEIAIVVTALRIWNLRMKGLLET